MIDINDKAKAEPEKVNKENIIKYDLRTTDNKIGKITNMATYWTTLGSAKGNVNKYDKELIILRMAQGSEIDFVKTGIRNIEIPQHISEYAKKYKPYFLQKYKYDKDNMIMNHVDKASMNILCKHIERWEKENFIWNKWESKDVDFSGNYLINKSLLKENKEKALAILIKLEEIYKNFNEEFSGLYLKNADENEWHLFFEKYSLLVNRLSNNKEILSSLAVYLTYKKYKKDNLTKSFVFPWCTCWEGIMLTLDKKRSSVRAIPQLVKDISKYKNEEIIEFLGRKYTNRFIVLETDTKQFIKKQYLKKSEKKEKNNIKTFEYETFMAGLQDKTGEEVSNLIKDNIVILKPKNYNGHEYVTLYIDDEYVGSLGKLEDFKIGDEIVDLKDYYNYKFKVEPVEVYDKSLKIKLKLVG